MRLIEETFPEHKIEREKAVERAMEIMEDERHKVYSVAPTGTDSRKRNAFGKVKNVLNKGRKG